MDCTSIRTSALFWRRRWSVSLGIIRCIAFTFFARRTKGRQEHDEGGDQDGGGGDRTEGPRPVAAVLRRIGSGRIRLAAGPVAHRPPGRGWFLGRLSWEDGRCDVPDGIGRPARPGSVSAWNDARPVCGLLPVPFRALLPFVRGGLCRFRAQGDQGPEQRAGGGGDHRTDARDSGTPDSPV